MCLQKEGVRKQGQKQQKKNCPRQKKPELVCQEQIIHSGCLEKHHLRKNWPKNVVYYLEAESTKAFFLATKGTLI